MIEQQKAKAVERARAWALANPERRREISLRSYLKHRPALKPVLTPHVPPPKRNLSEDQVREIRALRGKMGVVALAKLFGVDYTNISRIHTGKHYAHVS